MVDIAVVYRKPVSTEYLLSGVYKINGSYPNNLDDLDYIYNHYDELFEAVSGLTQQRLESDIARVDREMNILNDMLSERIASRSWAIDSRIKALSFQARLASPGAKKVRLKSTVLGMKLFRNMYIYLPLRSIRKEIRRKAADKKELMSDWPKLIEGHHKKLSATYHFIDNNRSYLASAKQEDEVIKSLSTLTNNYHVINNVSLSRKAKSPVKMARRRSFPCDIGHIVVGPSGLFLIVLMPPGNLNGEACQQFMRQAIELGRKVSQYLQMNDIPEYEVKPRTVIVTFKETFHGQYCGEYADLISLDLLSQYLRCNTYPLTDYAVDELVKLFNR